GNFWRRYESRTDKRRASHSYSGLLTGSFGLSIANTRCYSNSMSAKVRSGILGAGGFLLIFLGILHLAATPAIAHLVHQYSMPKAGDWLAPPMLLNHIVLGILLPSAFSPHTRQSLRLWRCRGQEPSAEQWH